MIAILAAGLSQADRLTSLAEEELFADPIVYAQTTHYQRIVITRGRAGFQLFLNGNLQFSSADEYRYHEALVHPAHGAGRASRGRCWCWAAAMGWRCARFSSIRRSSR